MTLVHAGAQLVLRKSRSRSRPCLKKAKDWFLNEVYNLGHGLRNHLTSGSLFQWINNLRK